MWRQQLHFAAALSPLHPASQPPPQIFLRKQADRHLNSRKEKIDSHPDRSCYSHVMASLLHAFGMRLMEPLFLQVSKWTARTLGARALLKLRELRKLSEGAGQS